jgi:purine-binding chemotaxis protein CheW
MSENTQGRHDCDQSAKRGGKRNKHLIFSLGRELFGIPLSEVKEVIGMVEITPVPNVPSFFKGIINLRGRIISVIDLKAKMGISRKTSDGQRPCIIICEFGDVVLGSIVDHVVEVHGYEESDIERSVDLQETSGRDYITGVAREREGALTLLLDIGRVLNIDEIQHLRQGSPKAA